MSPNFWGCRCCKSGRVAYINNDADYAVLSIKSGGDLVRKFTTGVEDGTHGDVLFLTKDRVAIKDQFSLRIYDKDTLIHSSILENGGGLTLATNGTDLLVPEHTAGSPSGRFRPYRCDFDGNVILTISQDATLLASPSTIVPLFGNPPAEFSTAIDSTGACYFAGNPWPHSDNYYGFWKIDPDGDIEWRIDTRQDGYLGVRPCSHVSVDASDNVYFVRWFFSGSVMRPVLYKMDPDGGEIWTMDFDFNPDVYPHGLWGIPIHKKMYLDNDGGWLYISQSEVTGFTTESAIRRYSLETGLKDPDYNPYFWPHISKVIVEKKSGDIFAVPSEIGGSNMLRYKADDGERVWGHDMSSGIHQSYNFDVWQE